MFCLSTYCSFKAAFNWTGFSLTVSFSFHIQRSVPPGSNITLPSYKKLLHALTLTAPGVKHTRHASTGKRYPGVYTLPFCKITQISFLIEFAFPQLSEMWPVLCIWQLFFSPDCFSYFFAHTLPLFLKN